jgi:hypothetical protein
VLIEGVAHLGAVERDAHALAAVAALDVQGGGGWARVSLAGARRGHFLLWQQRG